MSVVPFIEVRLKGVEKLTKKQLNDSFKHAWTLLGIRHRQLYLPLHFGPRAERRYHYTPRAGAQGSKRRGKNLYSQRKKRFLGHNRPLEYTGEAMRETLDSTTVRATRDGVKVPVSRKFNFRNPNSRVNMREEITKVLKSELHEQTVQFVKDLEMNLRAEGATKLRIFRSKGQAAPAGGFIPLRAA